MLAFQWFDSTGGHHGMTVDNPNTSTRDAVENGRVAVVIFGPFAAGYGAAISGVSYRILADSIAWLPMLGLLELTTAAMVGLISGLVTFLSASFLLYTSRRTIFQAFGV